MSRIKISFLLLQPELINVFINQERERNMKKSLVALAFGTLGLGIAEFTMMGLLPYVAADLGIGIPVAGHLISAYAMGVCCGAPLLLLARRARLKDILLALGIPHFIGLDAPEQNAGVVRNSGFEAMLGFRKKLGEVNFSASVNVSYNKNRWIDRGGDDTNIDGWTIQALDSPLNAFYIYEADGLIANDQELAEYKAKYKEDPRGMSVLKAGDVKLVDVNGDGTIDPDDRQIYNSNIPKFIYGINLSAEWKGFDLSLLFQGSSGSNRFLYGEFIEGPSYEAFTGIHFRDRWTETNQSADASMPRLEAANNRNMSTYNTFFMQNSSYLRLKNAQLGYTFSSNVTDKLRIQRLRLYLSGSNLFTISSLFQGLDPEGNDGRISTFPVLRIINFGVNIVF